MRSYRPETIHPITWLLFIGVAVLLVADVGQFVFSFAPKHHAINCESLKTYAEALSALPNNPGLDRNHDGRPCESQFPHTIAATSTRQVSGLDALDKIAQQRK